MDCPVRFTGPACGADMLYDVSCGLRQTRQDCANCGRSTSRAAGAGRGRPVGLGLGTRGGGAAGAALLDVCFALFGGARALASLPALASESFPKVYDLRQPILNTL